MRPDVTHRPTVRLLGAALGTITLLLAAAVATGDPATASGPGSALRTVRAASTSTQAPTPPTPLVSTAHPYSDPVYLPLHSTFYVDCVHNNPGCRLGHRTWQMDLIPYGQYYSDGVPSIARVHAMGAGLLHYGNANGDACGTKHPSYGTWVWIDHGSGTLSRYGHLSEILVPDGSLVSAGEKIGVVGTSGKGGSCRVNYTDVMVDHGGQQNARSVEIETLAACPDETPRLNVWPRSSGFTRWNDVPWHTIFPKTTAVCLPPTTPATSHAPVGLTVSRSAAGQLTARWDSPLPQFATDQVTIELSAYHPSTRGWDDSDHETYVTARSTRVGIAFSGLLRNHTYRIRVGFHNRSGWSRSTTWKYRSAT